jgi:hypothetical protein
VTFNLNGRGASPLSAAPNLQTRQNTATLLIPSQTSETAAQFLDSESPLPLTADPI